MGMTLRVLRRRVQCLPRSASKSKTCCHHADTVLVSLLVIDLRTLRYFVAVVEEAHFGRAAVRLHMTQPPLSRAVRQLEDDLGCRLLERTRRGVTPTPAGSVLHKEALTLLDLANETRLRVVAASATTALRIGTLADSDALLSDDVIAEFRQRHPMVDVRLREADLTDPSAGLRSGLVDIALTRLPFDTTGLTVRTVRLDPMHVVLRDDDPLAGRDHLCIQDLAGRRWFRLPDDVDPLWRAFWGAPAQIESSPGPVVRTVHECLHGVVWNGSIGTSPLTHDLPANVRLVPLLDAPPSPLVIAWPEHNANPLVASLVDLVESQHAAS